MTLQVYAGHTVTLGRIPRSFAKSRILAAPERWQFIIIYAYYFRSYLLL